MGSTQLNTFVYFKMYKQEVVSSSCFVHPACQSLFWSHADACIDTSRQSFSSLWFTLETGFLHAEMRSVTVSSPPSRRRNNSPRKQSGRLRMAARQSYAGWPGRHQELIRLSSDGRRRAVGRNTGGGRQREAQRGVVCVFRGGGQCKCYCCVSSFDQSPGKVKRIQSGFVWQSGDTGAGEETPRTENGLSYWLWSSGGLRRTVYSARNAFRQQLALITFIDFSGSVPRI